MIDDGTCYACPKLKWHEGPCEKDEPWLNPDVQKGLDRAALHLESVITEKEANENYTSRAMRMIFLEQAAKIRAIKGRG